MRFYHALWLLVLLVHCAWVDSFKSLRPLRVSRIRRAMYEDHQDISPGSNSAILKKIIRKGLYSKGKPYKHDAAEIRWKIYHKNGTMVHTSDVLEEPFEFRLGTNYSDVVPAWEIAIMSMYEGEIAEVVTTSQYGFPEEGFAPLDIGPNETVRAELELVEIIPSPMRKYRKLGTDPEADEEELIQKIQNGEIQIESGGPSAEKKAGNLDTAGQDGPVLMPKEFPDFESFDADEYDDHFGMDGSGSIPTANSVFGTDDEYDPSTRVVQPPKEAINGQSKSAGAAAMPETIEKEMRFFDASKDKVDPNEVVAGAGTGHSWEETISTIDIFIDLPKGTTKRDLNVHINSTHVDISHREKGLSIFSGPLNGKVRMDDVGWSVVGGRYEDDAQMHISLLKSHGYKDIWATVLSRKYLSNMPSADPSSID